MRLRLWVVGVSMSLSVTGCAGKRVATTFTDMAKHVPAGTTVYVTTTDGKEVKGALATVSASSMKVSLRDTSMRDFSDADVTRVRAKDRLWNGLLIGAAVGGFLTFAINDASCIEPYASPDCVKVSRGAGVAIGTALGAAVGTGFDALHHRRVFRGTSSTRGASLFFAPVVTPNVVAVRVSSRF
jgi:small nuclear ribonucleoprotein (snRNP)-like protein